MARVRDHLQAHYADDVTVQTLAAIAGLSRADVAADCGFADQSHFSRRFKGALGVTPAQWLRQMRA